MDDAKATKALKASLGVKARQGAQGDRRRSFRLGDRPQQIKAAPALAGGEGRAHSGGALGAAGAGEGDEVKAEQRVCRAAQNLAKGAREAGETARRVGLPEKAEERRVRMARRQIRRKLAHRAAMAGGGRNGCQRRSLGSR